MLLQNHSLGSGVLIAVELIIVSCFLAARTRKRIESLVSSSGVRRESWRVGPEGQSITSTIFWPFPFLHFCSSILFHSQQFLRGQGALEGLFQEFIAAGRLSPSKPLALRLTPVTCSSQACNHALPGISVAYFGVFLFSGHQMHPPTPTLIFFLLLPSQMQVLQLSLSCLRLCILSFMETACHPMCCDLCLWFRATARVTRSTGGWASLEGPEGPPWHFSHVASLSPRGGSHSVI